MQNCASVQNGEKQKDIKKKTSGSFSAHIHM